MKHFVNLNLTVDQETLFWNVEAWTRIPPNDVIIKGDGTGANRWRATAFALQDLSVKILAAFPRD